LVEWQNENFYIIANSIWFPIKTNRI